MGWDQTEPQPIKAAEWLEKAAGQGIPTAQNNLGLLYLRGEGVDEDPQTAARWLGAAANAGLAESQCRLGLMYERGRGVDQDSKTACMWLSLAAERGHARAAERLATLLEPMPPKDREEIARRAQAWNDDRARDRQDP